MPRGLRVRAAILALSLAPPACVRTGLHGLPPGGAFASAAPASVNVGGRAVTFSACRSGDRESFLGVDLLAPSDGFRLRVVQDPIDGPRLKLFRRETGDGEVLTPDRCRELRAAVRPTRWRVNEVRDVEGELAARCTLADGTVFEVKAAFRHCH